MIIDLKINLFYPNNIIYNFLMLSKKIGLDHILPRIRDSRISMRVDFNVPLKENVVKDVTRIKETIPSLKKIIEQ
jgi:phosphoglycerate kinase